MGCADTRRGVEHAVHEACDAPYINITDRTQMLRLLLATGADPCLRDEDGTPVNEAAVAVVEEAIDAKRAACLIMIRRLVVKQPEEVVLSEEEQRTAEEEGKAQILAAVVGLGNNGWKKDPFTELMELLLPVWSPLRKPLGGYREAVQWEENEDDSEEEEE